MMHSIEEVKAVLSGTLNLGARGSSLHAQTVLLGNLPELDSLAVIHLITALEERFGIVVDDDELTGDVFETVGSLTSFVDRKLAQ